MKLNKLIDPAFQTALKKVSAQELPLAAAFKLKGIMKRGDEELAKYEEIRKSALEKLGERDENGQLILEQNGTVKLSQENLTSFIGELNALLDTQVDIGTLQITELGNKLSISVSDLMVLGDILVG